ncbi:MAG: radical SAM protein [Deltaproteobacteria bacterium]|nr:radical SAM protein [Deltaproteobacteria bacterium]
MIIPIFIMNRGCPHRCLFCNEELVAENHPDRLEETGFRETVRTYLEAGRRRGGPVEIAFYGGTFTGMPREEQLHLLGLAASYLREGTVDHIRISTRPDEIDAAGLDMLQAFGVKTVEIGAQSLDDDVLRLSQRGHRAADTLRAMARLKERNFATGIHLMAGLPGDSPELFARTIDRVIALGPDTVRIHPTIVLRDTPLADAYRKGIYRPLTLTEAVTQCKEALKKLTSAWACRPPGPWRSREPSSRGPSTRPSGRLSRPPFISTWRLPFANRRALRVFPGGNPSHSLSPPPTSSISMVRVRPTLPP